MDADSWMATWKKRLSFHFKWYSMKNATWSLQVRYPNFFLYYLRKKLLRSWLSCVELEGQCFMCDLWVFSQPIYSLKLTVKLWSHQSGKWNIQRGSNLIHVVSQPQDLSARLLSYQIGSLLSKFVTKPKTTLHP